MNVIMNKKEVAKLLQFSERKIDYLRQDGKLPYIKIGRCVRFRLEDIQDFLQKQLVVPAETTTTKGV